MVTKPISIEKPKLTQLAQDVRGAAIIEFAFVAAPLIALILAVFQTSISLFTQQTLETAAEKVGRVVMTGQASSANMTATQFKNLTCSKLPSFMPCSSVMIDVNAFTSISSISTSKPNITYDNSGNVSNSWKFDLGDQGDIVIMRIMYLSPSAYGPLGFTLANQPNGKRLMVSTLVFKNESI
ncbi:TadE/TadG family type IV pilus assembly protein [Sphingobium vermicomposti]|uniref:Flp pilus assembly protein TadG n=1 Tax=Sphingobium vermicomposti TaxID=529005 RepID=A0A846M5N2_9SPHN|nr:TadE/TadG family type IV pilus assembly protein [Sphingobium vermicomposti]NIJ16458.1 Flp pilus assembly protein TadG [Sphingobium vermicomposti]